MTKPPPQSALSKDLQKSEKFIDGDYLDKHNVHELFAELLSQVLQHRPEDPISFLIEHLAHAPVRRVAVMGAPGADKTAFCRTICDQYKLVHVNTAELLRKAVCMP